MLPLEYPVPCQPIWPAIANIYIHYTYMSEELYYIDIFYSNRQCNSLCVSNIFENRKFLNATFVNSTKFFLGY